MTTTNSARRAHGYEAKLTWEGNLGTGTSSYASYGRQFRVEIAGKVPLSGSADPLFRGDGALYNPEDLLMAAAASCHMLSYLALSAKSGIVVVAYEDSATGTLVFDGKGGGKFEEITLRPRVTIADESSREVALALHTRANADCFIAQSCSFPIYHKPEIETV